MSVKGNSFVLFYRCVSSSWQQTFTQTSITAESEVLLNGFEQPEEEITAASKQLGPSQKCRTFC